MGRWVFTNSVGLLLTPFLIAVLDHGTVDGDITKNPFIASNLVDEGTILVNLRDANAAEQRTASNQKVYRSQCHFLYQSKQLEQLYPAVHESRYECL